MRKSIDYVIKDEAHPGNRDNGKKFIITEWPAIRAAKWARRVGFALANSGVNLPTTAGSGMAMLAALGPNILNLKHADIGPLCDELLECVTIQDGVLRELTRPLNADIDIEEIQTVFLLQYQVFNLHAEFFFTAAQSTSEASSKPVPTSSPTPTSTPKSVRLSRQARQHGRN